MKAEERSTPLFCSAPFFSGEPTVKQTNNKKSEEGVWKKRREANSIAYAAHSKLPRLLHDTHRERERARRVLLFVFFPNPSRYSKPE
jgi:hypothetical protein